MLRLPLGKLGTTLAGLTGVLVGVGTFTFDYAEGFSYFSTDPAACANCHVMRPQYEAWSRGPHHHVAGCADCHLPAAGVPKYVAKAENGYRHSYAFTFQNFHEPIQMTPKNARILQDNCVRCHGDFVHGIVAGSKTDAGGVQCVHCHARVGHGGEGWAAGVGWKESR
jgi:cytochrome c nitrite reductase small subunit